MTDEVFVGNGNAADEAQNAAAELAYRTLTEKIPTQKSKTPPAPSKTPVVLLNGKYLKKEIEEPIYKFTQLKENKQTVWFCSLSLKNGGDTISAKAASRKKAKQAAAQGMLAALELEKKSGIVHGQGLLRLALSLQNRQKSLENAAIL